MNVFHVTKKKTIFGVIAVLVLVIYIPLNVMYIMFASSGYQQNDLVKTNPNSILKPDSHISVQVSNIESSVDGNVNIVLSISVKDLVSFLEGENMHGEATHNPVPREVKLLINNPDLCEQYHHDLKYIVYVHTSPDHLAKRNLLRKTWANTNLFNSRIIQTVFLMGMDNDPNIQEKVEEESSQHHDIVQGDFHDNYRNLTLKGVMGLKWVSTYCKQAKFAIKADDDAFVDIFHLVKMLEKNENKKNMLACPLWNDNTMPILRDPAKCAKWCVKFNEFPGRRYFPQYCAGLTFILSNDLVPKMFEVAKSTPFFWVDDVYITGLLPGKIKDMDFVKLNNNFTLKHDEAMTAIQDMTKPLNYLLIHAKKQDQFMPMWNALLKRLTSDDVKQLSTDAIEGSEILKKKLMRIDSR